MNRRLTALFTSLILALSMTGCTTDTVSDTAEDTTNNTTVIIIEEDETIKADIISTETADDDEEIPIVLTQSEALSSAESTLPNNEKPESETTKTVAETTVKTVAETTTKTVAETTTKTVAQTTVSEAQTTTKEVVHVTVPEEEENDGFLVWVPTNGGKKYHSYSGCSNMIDPIQVSVETAEKNGYTPCKRCHYLYKPPQDLRGLMLFTEYFRQFR